MTQRDWFAGIAMQGLVAGKYLNGLDKESSLVITKPENFAAAAYAIADAMVKESEKHKSTGAI